MITQNLGKQPFAPYQYHTENLHKPKPIIPSAKVTLQTYATLCMCTILHFLSIFI